MRILLSHRQPREDMSFDRRDNSRGMPKAVVVDETFNWGRREIRPSIPWEQTIIYEAHIKGLTQARGGCAAEPARHLWRPVSPAMIAHLKTLGVTTRRAVADPRLHRRSRAGREEAGQLLGYNTLSFFAPEPRYARTIRSMRSAPGGAPARRRHRGDAGCRLQPHRRGKSSGADAVLSRHRNASYYWLKPDNKRYYDDFTGCGSSVNLTHPRVLQMVMDSLRYWVEVCHVDGFRFDLATTLARGPNGFERNAAFLTAVRQDPVLAKREARRRALGPRHGRLPGRRFFPRNGRNGTTAIAVPCAATGAVKAA